MAAGAAPFKLEPESPARRRPPANAPGPLATWQPGPIAPAPHPAPVGSLLDLVAAVRSRRFLTFKQRACSNYHDIFKFLVCKKKFHVRSCSACSACSQLVQGMFTRPEHAKHAIDCKIGKYFSDHVSFRHFMLRHVQRVQHVSACSHLVLIVFDLCSQKIKA